MFTKIVFLTLIYTTTSSVVRNPCKNIIDDYQTIYEKNKKNKMKSGCWENIYNRLTDNSNYKYDNICVYAFEKHICKMIVYNNENYKNLPKNWCINEYKNAINTYEKKCSRGNFELLKKVKKVKEVKEVKEENKNYNNPLVILIAIIFVYGRGYI